MDARVFRADLNVAAAATDLVALSKGLHLLLVMTTDTLVDDAFSAEAKRLLTGQPSLPPDIQAG